MREAFLSTAHQLNDADTTCVEMWIILLDPIRAPILSVPLQGVVVMDVLIYAENLWKPWEPGDQTQARESVGNCLWGTWFLVTLQEFGGEPFTCQGALSSLWLIMLLSVIFIWTTWESGLFSTLPPVSYYFSSPMPVRFFWLLFMYFIFLKLVSPSLQWICLRGHG